MKQRKFNIIPPNYQAKPAEPQNKPTDFGLCLSKFLTDEMVDKKGCTPRTIDSYRFTFILLLRYFDEKLKIPADKVCMSDITYHNVLGFLSWLESDRDNGVSTRNQRRAAINSFVRFAMYEKPEYLAEFQLILGIPIKKAPEKAISYLKTDGIALLMDCVDIEKPNGLRDYLMLLILYSTGIRVSELIEIRVCDLFLSEPYTLLVHGKGGVSRYVSLIKDSVPIINDYLKKMGYNRPERREEWLFVNHSKMKFTRSGVTYIIKKYGDIARKKDPSLIPKDLSPHKIRHTTAMELVDAGVDLLFIRDLLGHKHTTTTEIYAKTNNRTKRAAIEAASKNIVPTEKPLWEDNPGLLDWLTNFKPE